MLSSQRIKAINKNLLQQEKHNKSKNKTRGGPEKLIRTHKYYVESTD